MRGDQEPAQEVEAAGPPALGGQHVHGQDAEVVRAVHLVGALHPLLTRLLLEALQVLLLPRRGPRAVEGGGGDCLDGVSWCWGGLTV